MATIKDHVSVLQEGQLTQPVEGESIVPVGPSTTTLDQAYNNHGPLPATINVDNAEGQGRVLWNLLNQQFKIDVSPSTSDVGDPGFVITDDSGSPTNYIQATRRAGGGLFYNINVDRIAETSQTSFDIAANTILALLGSTGVNVESAGGYVFLAAPNGNVNLYTGTGDTDINFNARGSGPIPFNDASNVTPDPGFTETSIVGILNELYGSVSGNAVRVYATATNLSGGTLSCGNVVYISGAASGLLTVDLADAKTYDKTRVLGVVDQDILNGASGTVTIVGTIECDTSAFSAGDMLYLSDTTQGVLTATKPGSENFVVILGHVQEVGTPGKLFVRPEVPQNTEEVIAVTGWPLDPLAKLTYSFDNGTRTLTLTPTTGSDFHFYENGVKYIKVSDTFTISDVDGQHLIYYDKGSMAEVVDPDPGTLSNLMRTKPFVAYYYWRTSTQTHIYEGKEPHQFGMPPLDHTYLHFVFGAQWQGGLGLNNFVVDASGDVDSHAQFSADQGFMADEDLFRTILSHATTEGIPVLYKEGANGYWQRDNPTGFSVKSFVGGNNRLAWNEWTGSTWQQSEVPNNDFVLCHIWAINDSLGKGLIAMQGQATYATLSAARAGADGEILSVINFPGSEKFPVATIIFQTSNSYSNAVKARVRSTDTGGDYINWLTTALVSGVSPGDHANLTNRDAEEQHPFEAIEGPTTDSLLPSALSTLFDAQSSGHISGGDIQIDDTQLSIDSGVGLLRTSASETAPIVFAPWPSYITETPPADTTLYIGVHYNGGTPQVTTRVADDWNYLDEFPLGVIIVDSEGEVAFNIPHRYTNALAYHDARISETEPIKRAYGLELGTDNLEVAMSQGRLWASLSPFNFDAVDTGAGDQIDRYYKDGVGGWNVELDETEWENQSYDDGTGTLAPLQVNRYSTRWVYLHLPSGQLDLVYGVSNVRDVADAYLETIPTELPPRLAEQSILIGEIILQNGVAVAVDVLSAWEPGLIGGDAGGIDPHGTTHPIDGSDPVLPTYEYDEDINSGDTSSTTWGTRASVTISAGTWEIKWDMSVDSSSFGTTVPRFRVYNSTDATAIIEATNLNSSPGGGGTEHWSHSGFRSDITVTASKTIELQFSRNPAFSGTVYWKNPKLKAIKLAPAP